MVISKWYGRNLLWRILRYFRDYTHKERAGGTALNRKKNEYERSFVWQYLVHSTEEQSGSNEMNN